MSEWSTVFSAPEGWVSIERRAVDDHWQYAVSSGATFPGAVAVATRGDTVLLVRSHRPVLDREMWEFPRGFGEPTDESDPDPAARYTAAARRELHEETGLAGGEAALLGVVHPNSGLLKDRVRVVHIAEPRGTATALDEIERTTWRTWRDLELMTAAGEITDAFTLAAMTLYRAASTES